MEEKNTSMDEKVETKKISDKIFIYIALGIILVVAAIIGLKFIFKEEAPKTIDDLHKLNLEGKLPEDQGYIYSGYSFVKYDGMWHTQMMSPLGTREYNIFFRYGPKEAIHVPIYGQLNLTLFNDAKDYYVTFNPMDEGLQYVALAVNDFNQQMINIFFKIPIPACDRNETVACTTVPIINCTNTDKLVFYLKQADETAVNIYNNCIVVEGTDLELVRAVDKVLYTFYGIL
jgi:hypothetical protein